MSHHNAHPGTASIRTGRRRTARAAVAAVAVLSLGMTATGCGDDPGGDVDRTSVEEGEPGLEDIEPRPVTMSGKVREVISPDAFLLGGEGGDQPILVVNAEPDVPIAEETTVVVTGILHTAFDLPVVEDELGRDLDDEDLAGHEEAPYIVAEEVEPAG